MLALKLGQNIGGIANRNSFSNVFSLDYDGVDDYVNLSSAVGVVDVNRGTFSAWVKLETTSINAPVFKYYVNANNQITIIYLHSSNQIKFMYKAAGTNTQVQAATAIEGGAYAHVALTWDTGANELKAFINGTQFGTTQSGFGTWSGSATVLHLGHNALSGSDFWKGNIDEFAIFSRAKTNAEILSIYNGGKPSNLVGESDLVGYWRNEEGSGTTIGDQSGQGNSGTLINGTTFSTDVA